MIPKMPTYEVPPEMREFAEKSVEQARKAFDGFIGAANKAVDTFGGSNNAVQANATDLTKKAFTYAEKNVSAAFDLAQKLVRAKDPQEVLQHQAAFLQAQIAALQSQMKEFGSEVQDAMNKAMKK